MLYFITLSEAVAMTTLYRAEHENVLQASYQNKAILPLSETFDREAFDAILSKTGCTSLRLYYGMTENLQVHAVIVGVDAAGHDILPPAAGAARATGDEEDFIIEHGVRCPDICPATSPLNG